MTQMPIEQASFPVKLRFKAAHLEELHNCEFGSYEDNIQTDDIGGLKRLPPYNKVKADGSLYLHIVEIIERSGKTVVELRDQQELDEFFGSATSGTFGLYHPRVCMRIFHSLIKHISDDVPKWLRSAGHIGY